MLQTRMMSSRKRIRNPAGMIQPNCCSPKRAARTALPVTRPKPRVVRETKPKRTVKAKLLFLLRAALLVATTPASSMGFSSFTRRETISELTPRTSVEHERVDVLFFKEGEQPPENKYGRGPDTGTYHGYEYGDICVPASDWTAPGIGIQRMQELRRAPGASSTCSTETRQYEDDRCGPARGEVVPRQAGAASTMFNDDDAQPLTVPVLTLSGRKIDAVQFRPGHTLTEEDLRQLGKAVACPKGHAVQLAVLPYGNSKEQARGEGEGDAGEKPRKRFLGRTQQDHDDQFVASCPAAHQHSLVQEPPLSLTFLSSGTRRTEATSILWKDTERRDEPSEAAHDPELAAVSRCPCCCCLSERISHETQSDPYARPRPPSMSSGSPPWAGGIGLSADVEQGHSEARSSSSSSEQARSRTGSCISTKRPTAQAAQERSLRHRLQQHPSRASLDRPRRRKTRPVFICCRESTTETAGEGDAGSGRANDDSGPAPRGEAASMPTSCRAIEQSQLILRVGDKIPHPVFAGNVWAEEQGRAARCASEMRARSLLASLRGQHLFGDVERDAESRPLYTTSLQPLSFPAVSTQQQPAPSSVQLPALQLVITKYESIFDKVYRVLFQSSALLPHYALVDDAIHQLSFGYDSTSTGAPAHVDRKEEIAKFLVKNLVELDANFDFSLPLDSRNGSLKGIMDLDLSETVKLEDARLVQTKTTRRARRSKRFLEIEDLLPYERDYGQFAPGQSSVSRESALLFNWRSPDVSNADGRSSISDGLEEVEQDFLREQQHTQDDMHVDSINSNPNSADAEERLATAAEGTDIVRPITSLWSQYLIPETVFIVAHTREQPDAGGDEGDMSSAARMKMQERRNSSWSCMTGLLNEDETTDHGPPDTHFADSGPSLSACASCPRAGRCRTSDAQHPADPKNHQESSTSSTKDRAKIPGLSRDILDHLDLEYVSFQAQPEIGWVQFFASFVSSAKSRGKAAGIVERDLAVTGKAPAVADARRPHGGAGAAAERIFPGAIAKLPRSSAYAGLPLPEESPRVTIRLQWEEPDTTTQFPYPEPDQWCAPLEFELLISVQRHDGVRETFGIETAPVQHTMITRSNE
ncbi:unnamed protein product [Amoebophrya sp. A120]|nr:unnamed protein product [Amoebophrya sp. A120]|eukprot:GSA120T00010502001.1